MKWHFIAIIAFTAYFFYLSESLAVWVYNFSFTTEIDAAFWSERLWKQSFRSFALVLYASVFIPKLLHFLASFVGLKQRPLKNTILTIQIICGILIIGHILFILIFSVPPESSSKLEDQITHIGVTIFFLRIVGSFLLFEFLRLGYRRIAYIRNKGWYQRLFRFGFGGSAEWAKLSDFENREAKVEEEGHGKRLKYPFLGKSLFDDDPLPRPIVSNDDSHLVTCGMTGAGKSTTVLFPNLATYKGKIYAFDPKGELAKSTFRRRSEDYYLEEQKVKPGNTRFHTPGTKSFILDPYEETKGEFPYSNFNPLFGIDLESNRSAAILNAISDGCVIQSKNDKDIHWNEWAKNIIEGLVVHAISRYPEENHNLPFVLDMLTGSSKPYYDIPEEQRLSHFDELLTDMITNEAFGGLPKQIATRIMGMGENERGSVLSAAFRHLKWVGDPAMRQQLSETTIGSEYERFAQFSSDTVYIILPSDMISTQLRWVRVLMGVFLSHEKNIYKPDKYGVLSSTLFLIDEFGQLGGNIDAITNGFPILRGYNIRLWLFVQSMSQLKYAFDEKWTDVISASTVQAFGVNDNETSEWISKRLGMRVNSELRKTKWFGRGRSVGERIDPLLTPDEVEYFLGKNSKMQIVFPPNGRPMRMERMSYKPLPGFNQPSFNLEGHFEDY